jgi:hypothetical protein
MDKYWKFVSVVLVLVLLATSMTLAGNKNRIGSAGAQELLIPVGARGIALGGSAISSVTGVDALYWNPAGIVRGANNVETMFSYTSYMADIGVNYAAVVAKAGNIGTFGFSVKSLSFGDIPVTTEDFPDGTGEKFSPSFLNVGFSYANQLIDRVSVGVTATLISHTIMSTTAAGVGFSFGIQYTGLGVQGLSLGIALKNVGPSMRMDGSNLYRTANLIDAPNKAAEFLSIKAAPYELPTTLELGVGYVQKFGEKSVVNVSGDFSNNNFSDDEYKLGAEFVYNDMFSARAGYTFAPTIANSSDYLYGYNLGVGVHTTVSGIHMAVDYAYQYTQYFNGNNIVTIALGF